VKIEGAGQRMLEDCKDAMELYEIDRKAKIIMALRYASHRRQMANLNASSYTS